jgi:peptidoglycan/xylan/chitin deacetylase (PgdA/CDA1 family)
MTANDRTSFPATAFPERPPRPRRDLTTRFKGTVRSIVTPAWVAGGFAARALKRSRHGALILMYHSIIEARDRMSGPAATEEAAAAFGRHMMFLREHMRPMPLSELVTSVVSGRPLPSNAVAVTFDDGYEDNYTVAFPVLRDLQIPATIYLATGAINGPSPFWWDAVSGVIEGSDAENLDLDEFAMRAGLPWRLQGSLPLKTCDHKQRAIDHVCALLRISKCGSNPSSLDVLRTLLNVSTDQTVPAMLRWAQIEEMSNAGIEFGAHTVSHPDLTQIDRGSALSEMADSNGTLSHWNAELEEVARSVGFHGVVSAEAGVVRGRTNPFWLPRLSLARPLGDAVWTMCKHLRNSVPSIDDGSRVTA